MTRWEPVMTRWASNTTWLEIQGSESPRKRAKRARHVVLCPRHVALGLQHDVARDPRVQIPQKESKTSAPRRIGSPPCRVGPPTRRGTSPKAPKHPKRAQNEHAMSHWEPAMTRWASNTTWLEFQGTESPQKGAKRARHVVLGVRHDALGLQHDVARAQRRRTAPKGGKKSAPRRIGSTLCRVGPPTRRGSPTSDSIILRQALINGGVIILVAGVVAFVEWVEIFS